MQRIVPCLWYDGAAEVAAEFYVSLLPDSRIERVMKSPSDTPGGPAGSALTVEFTLDGRRYLGLNGGPGVNFNHAVSFQILCDTQAEVDRLWTALADGGTEVQCGWIQDRWGLSWQIVPTRLMELLNDPDRDRARRAQEAMHGMVKIDIAAIEAAAA
ncbi:VOC family protein [Alienimonas chondri]|uniref:PhnB-like domain-containing protein n=1 Tax=Alienimonas chondri TaxID=2681879 RepID=A0ABX1VFX1_9PLAN|nr:VOC family protein [Alienimonas chondri]NNJ27024.1 hypothetical protein [Alienimonas chondri]